MNMQIAIEIETDENGTPVRSRAETSGVNMSGLIIAIHLLMSALRDIWKTKETFKAESVFVLIAIQWLENVLSKCGLGVSLQKGQIINKGKINAANSQDNG